MNVTIFMLKRKEDGKIIYALKMNGRKELFVIDTIIDGDEACILEYDEMTGDVFDRNYQIIMYKKDFNLIEFMGKAFKSAK